MLKIKYHTSFKKDYKKVVKRGYDIKLLEDVIKKLANGEQLPEKNHDHNLTGDYSGCRECHITPDWLLIREGPPLSPAQSPNSYGSLLHPLGGTS